MKYLQFFDDLKNLVLNKDDIIIEAIEKDLAKEGIKELLNFWNEKVISNLSKFYLNKQILGAIDEIDKKIQKIDEKYNNKKEENSDNSDDSEKSDKIGDLQPIQKEEKDTKEDKRKRMISMHNEGKTKTTYKKSLSANSNLLFNTPLVSDSFQNVIKKSKNEEKETNENIIDSLDNASFTPKKEELDKNVISVIRYKKKIIGYLDLDLLLQRIAMETPVFPEDEMNDYLIEGICLQHPNFIVTNILISKIISCFNFNYSRYLKNEDENEEDNEDTRTRTENFCINYEDIKKKRGKKIYVSSKDVIENINENIELFNDTEKRLPYGLVTLIIAFIKTYQKYPIGCLDLEIASKIKELLNTALNIYEIKNIYENDIIKSKEIITKIINASEIQKPKQKLAFEKIYGIKNSTGSRFDIFSFSSKDIATELTRISYIYFSRITPKEFFKGLFTKKDKEKTSPNICRVVERFNEISYWVIEEVLSYDYSSDRAKVVEKFIHIANELKNLNNFNDCMSIVSALGQMILTRLNKTWKKVASKNLNLLQKIKKLLNFQNNYKNIRDEISICLKQEKPFLPFLGYYSKRICFLEESGPYVNKNGLINVDKISQVEQILSEFYEKNKVSYNFEIREDIKNKLSILQCLAPNSEDDLEKEGNLIEPNFVLCKKTKNKRLTNTEKKFEENYEKNNIV